MVKERESGVGGMWAWSAGHPSEDSDDLCRIPMGRRISSRDLREKARKGLGKTLGSLVLGMLVMKALCHRAVGHLQCLLDDHQ